MEFSCGRSVTEGSTQTPTTVSSAKKMHKDHWIRMNGYLKTRAKSRVLIGVYFCDLKFALHAPGEILQHGRHHYTRAAPLKSYKIALL